MAPRWNGPRPDLLTVGGDSLNEREKWSNCNRELLECHKIKILGRVIETAVLVCMGTHTYSFGDKLFLQQEGGPIGMRFTASLANVTMNMWDRAWSKVMEMEKLTHYLFLRYLDDVRLFLPALNLTACRQV